MRLVLVSNTQIGKTLAMPIYTNKGFIFMREGNTITESMVFLDSWQSVGGFSLQKGPSAPC